MKIFSERRASESNYITKKLLVTIAAELNNSEIKLNSASRSFQALKLE